jgi:hypothetical protein
MAWRKQDRTGNYDTAWRRARLACLRRTRWRCEIRLEGICIGAASEVDHIDGIANDPHHRRIRAACEPCHKHVTARQGVRARGGRGADPQPRPRTNWG